MNFRTTNIDLFKTAVFIIVAALVTFPFLGFASKPEKKEILEKIPLSELNPLDVLKDVVGPLNLDLNSFSRLKEALIKGQASEALKLPSESSYNVQDTLDDISLREALEMLRSFFVTGLQVFVVILEALLTVVRSVLSLVK